MNSDSYTVQRLSWSWAPVEPLPQVLNNELWQALVSRIDHELQRSFSVELVDPYTQYPELEE